MQGDLIPPQVNIGSSVIGYMNSPNFGISPMQGYFAPMSHDIPRLWLAVTACAVNVPGLHFPETNTKGDDHVRNVQLAY